MRGIDGGVKGFLWKYGYTFTPNHDYFRSQDDEELRKVHQI